MELYASTVGELPRAPEFENVPVQIVVPGEVICEAAGYMRGHGTYLLEGQLVASLAGVVERVNKFVSVKPLRSRYAGDVGDVVVGRVRAVQQQRWKVDVHAKQHAALLLSSINLPDQLQMRTYFAENDLISAEVQQFFQDGAMSLHTRHKYGKLGQGVLVTVPPSLVRRAKSHFKTLNCGVDIVRCLPRRSPQIIGTNGAIWVAPAGQSAADSSAAPVSRELRLHMARVRNAVAALARRGLPVHPLSIAHAFARSAELGLAPKDMLRPQAILDITTALDSDTS